MYVEPASYADHLDIAQLLLEHVDGRSTIRICRNRATKCVQRGLRKGAFCLVCRDNDSTIRGFLYAERIEALELAPEVWHWHVVYLTGRHCAIPLLRDLRKRTGGRILMQTHRRWGRIESYERLLRIAVPSVKQVGALFEI